MTLIVQLLVDGFDEPHVFVWLKSDAFAPVMEIAFIVSIAPRR